MINDQGGHRVTTSPLPRIESEEYDGAVLRVYGPPGTGKTTYLAKRVQSTIAQHGPTSTLISSFSVTAAKEIASRFAGDLRPPAHMIGTLHSHAFRAIGHPVVALDPKVLGDWNEQVAPEWAITPSSRHGGGNVAEAGAFVADPTQARTGDELVGAMDRLKAALVDPLDWPPNVREFAEKYEAWKRERGAIDFTDMIVEAYHRARDGERPPGNPSRFVVDEAQDMTPLEIALVLEWGRSVERLVLGMDDDQAINRWRGGDPEPLLNLHGPNVTDHVLDQSWRVPEAVRQVAERWVRNLSHRREKEYRPRLDENQRPVIGAAYRVPLRLNSPDLVAAALEETDAGRTVMIIAACNYMLEPLVANLRAEGVPFHNPFRPAEGRWNPLGQRGEGITSTAERVRRYLALTERNWTGSDIQAWADLVKVKDAGMRLGAKKAIAAFAPNAEIPWEEIEALFSDPDQLARCVEPDLDWLASCLLKDKQKPAEYPIQIARRHGAAALDVEPRVIVGTIHSVKGAAADVVYLAPDISAAAARSMGNPTLGRSGVDEAIRQFYVGMTRAYQELRVLAPSSNNHLKPAELIPSTLEVFPS